MDAPIIWEGKQTTPIASLSGRVRTDSDEFHIATILTDARHEDPKRAALEMLGEHTLHQTVEDAQAYASQRLKKLAGAVVWEPPAAGT